MESETKSPEIETQSKFSSLNRITPLSKYLALLLFIILPFVGGYVGYVLAPDKIVVKEIVKSGEDINTGDISPVQYEDLPKNTPRAVFDEVLKNEKLGIQLRVPAKIMAYANPESKGCPQRLIFGVPTETVIYLMPEKTSCEPDALSLIDSGSFEDALSKKIEIIPVNNVSEIIGIVKAKISNNSLINVYDEDGKSCYVETVTASIDANKALNQFGTVPVKIDYSNNCEPINPHALTVRYSPTFKKAIFFESTYGYGDDGDYYVNDTDGTFDLDIYSSLEVLH